MDYLSKGVLQTYLNHNPPLSEDPCREVVSQVLKGLQIMHREGFAHRDVKPAVSDGNDEKRPRGVLTRDIECSDTAVSDNASSQGWWVKLTDFGISKRVEAPVAGNPTFCGTPGYMPPEMIRHLLGLSSQGVSLPPDYPAGDMWSLGVMMFRILTGSDPFPSMPDVLIYCDDDARPFPVTPLVSERISPPAMAFARTLLHPMCAQRQEAIGHVWIQGHPSSGAATPSIIQG
jgi:serine/threonine protein kinase